MFSVYIRKIISNWVFENIIFVLLKRSLYNCNLFVIGIYVKCLKGKYTPKNSMINFFAHKKKKFRPTSKNGRFPILRPNLRPLLGIGNFISSKFNLLVYVFGVKFAGK